MSEALIVNELQVVSLDDDEHTESVVPSARPVDNDVEHASLGNQLIEGDKLKGGHPRPFIIKSALGESTHPGSNRVIGPLNEDDSTVGEIEYEVPSSLGADPNTVGRVPWPAERSSGRSSLVRFFKAWSTTVPDAVGVPGLRYVVSKQDGNRRRLIWFLAITVGFVAAGYQVTDRASYLMGNPQRVDLDIFYSNNLTFPAITICNYNNFRLSTMLEHYPFLAQFLADINNVNGSEVNFTAYKQQFEGVNTTEMYLQLAHPIGDMIEDALWNYAPIPAQRFKTVMTDYGVCHTLNGGHDGQELFRVINGYSPGLLLYLNIEQYKYYYSKRDRGAAGLLVVVHDQDDIPLVESFGIAVSAGAHTRISLKKKLYFNQKPASGSTKLKNFSSYTKNKCQLECLSDHIHRTCGCVEPYMAAFATDKRVCDLVEVFQCSQPATEEFAIGEECSCPVAHVVTQFVPFVSHALYPSNFYSRELTKYFIDGNAADVNPFFQKNFILLEVYYEDSFIDKSVQYEAYNFFGFLCDMGGAIGLWLGGSILTFLEILEHVYHTMFVSGDVLNF